MSRVFKDCQDERDMYIVKLDDPDLCRYLINDVCCNADNWNRVGDFTWRNECVAGRCPYFEIEPLEELAKLRKGIKEYDGVI